MKRKVILIRLLGLFRYFLSGIGSTLTLSLPVTHMCVDFSTVYNDMLVAKGLMSCFCGVMVNTSPLM